jgi:uncharacterized OB-fold protein
MIARDGLAVLLGARCTGCDRRSFPARAVCAACGSREQAATELSGRGTVHACVRVETPPQGFDGPYLFGLIDLDEGPRTFGIVLAEPGDDGRVIAVPAPLRDSVAGFAFRPEAVAA